MTVSVSASCVYHCKECEGRDPRASAFQLEDKFHHGPSASFPLFPPMRQQCSHSAFVDYAALCVSSRRLAELEERVDWAFWADGKFQILLCRAEVHHAHAHAIAALQLYGRHIRPSAEGRSITENTSFIWHLQAHIAQGKSFTVR